MAMSTSLIGPYDDIPTHDKVRVMCGVPLAVTKSLFDELFNQRGVQDKILARMFYIFYLEITSARVQKLLADAVTIRDREEVLNDVLNRLTTLQINNENQDVQPNESTDAHA